MFYEEFELYPADDSYKAAYYSDDHKIIYNCAYFYSINDWIETITHEWLHGLIDWGLDGHEIKVYKDAQDPTGEGDHFIMKLIGYD